MLIECTADDILKFLSEFDYSKVERTKPFMITYAKVDII